MAAANGRGLRRPVKRSDKLCCTEYIPQSPHQQCLQRIQTGGVKTTENGRVLGRGEGGREGGTSTRMREEQKDERDPRPTGRSCSSGSWAGDPNKLEGDQKAAGVEVKTLSLRREASRASGLKASQYKGRTGIEC